MKIMQFNIANYTFFDSYINDLSYYAWFYVNQFSKKLAVKILIENNTEHAINFKKKEIIIFQINL